MAAQDASTAAGSILPNKRIVAFYGNPLSKRMGILGEFETSDMLAKLERDAAEWTRLDPAHPAQPALHLIAVVAQGDAGRDAVAGLPTWIDAVGEPQGAVGLGELALTGGRFYGDVVIGARGEGLGGDEIGRAHV